MKKFCTKCGHEFEAVGREVICPACKESARLEAKKAAVLRAKKASWNGESVPVRISGRASTVIRAYGTAHNLPFAESLDALLKASTFFTESGKAWEEIEPYRSHRRDRNTTETAQEVKQTAQDAPQDVQAVQEVKQEATGKAAAKTVKATGKAAAKAAKTNKAGKATNKTANKK